MAYKQKGFSPFTASEEELERRRKKKLKEQQQLQDKIDKFNQQDPYSVDYGTDIEKVSEQIKGYVPSNKPGSKKSTIISTRQLTKTTPTETGFDVSKSDDFLVRERKKDFKKARFKKKDRTYTPTRGRGVAIAKTFQGKRPVDETDQGRIFYDRGDKGAEGRFASSEVARIGKRFKPKQKYGIIQKAAGKLFKRSKVKGLTLPEVEAGGKKFKESYMQSGGKRRTTKKTRREKGSLKIK
jgi:hypothetical protein